MRPVDRPPWWEAQAWAAFAEADRRRRRQGTKLIIVSAVFVAASIFSLFVIGQLIGLVSLLFFGACLVAGIIMRGDPDSPTTRPLALCVSLVLALACVLMFVFTLFAMGTMATNWSQPVVLIISAVGFVFFGIGGVVAQVRTRRPHMGRS